MRNAKDIVFGGVYKLAANAEEILSKNGYHKEMLESDDHAYRYFLPVAVEMPCNTGNNETFIYMIDTFKIDRPHYDDFEELVEVIKSWGNPDNGCKIRSQTYSYYYSGSFRLTDETAPAFELLCDLSKVKPIHSDEAVKYEEGNVFWNVPLYHEHNYTWGEGTKGLILVNKNAEQSGEKCLKAALRKITNLKLDDLYYQIIQAKDELTDVVFKFPWLCDEFAKEIHAGKTYISALLSIQELADLSLSPNKETIANYLKGSAKPDFVVQTEAGKLIAREEKDEYKGIGLYFVPNGYTEPEPLALAECHDDPGKRVADETCNDVMLYTYTDDFGEPIKHVRSAKAINQHYANQEVVRPLTPDDAYNVGVMDEDSDFNVANWLDSGRAYGIFDEDGFLDGYCTLGDADFDMPDCVTKDENYDPNNSLVLSNVYVGTQLRHRGYAMRMIREAIKQAWESKRMSTSVYLNIVDDEEVVKLYEKIGFKMLEPKDELYMVLDPKEFR